MRVIRVGTRGSKLALAQTGTIVRELTATHVGIQIETVPIKTTGDARPDVPFAAVGTKGMFVKEIEEALLRGDIDFAVHSMKDMPGELTPGLAFAATPPRVDARDALVSSFGTLEKLPLGSRVGTSSLRRKAQLSLNRADLRVQELRGNLDTRLRKLDEGTYDAIVLACAGLERSGFSDRIAERLPLEHFIPAPGQGVLALEIREQDDEMLALLEPLNDFETSVAVQAERAFQATLGAGCTVPVGAHAVLYDNSIRFIAMIASPNGVDSVRMEAVGPVDTAEQLGLEAANDLLRRGGQRLLDDSH